MEVLGIGKITFLFQSMANDFTVLLRLRFSISASASPAIFSCVDSVSSGCWSSIIIFRWRSNGFFSNHGIGGRGLKGGAVVLHPSPSRDQVSGDLPKRRALHRRRCEGLRYGWDGRRDNSVERSSE